jgi:SagB-type dehydrogenase family enzyme
MILLAVSALVLLLQVSVAAPRTPPRACGSAWDVVAGRAGWPQWWAADLSDPGGGALARTLRCPDAVNARILAGLLLLLPAQAFARRRSQRDFRPDPLPLATLSQLLWAGQGVTSPDGKRAAPSAGALYPLELYVVTSAQVMHYLPDGHRAETRAVPDLRAGLEAAAFGQPSVGAAPAVIVVAAVPGRTRRKYGTRAEAFVDREAGHATQNILLQAAARGLAAVPVGSLDPSRAAATLALPPGQIVLYFIPVGLSL